MSSHQSTDLESLQGEVERLTGLLEERTDSLRAMTKDRDRLRRALNDAGDALGDAEDTLASAVLKAARIIERALLGAPADPELERLMLILRGIASCATCGVCQAAAASAIGTPTSWTAGDGTCNCGVKNAGRIIHDSWCHSLKAPPADVGAPPCTCREGFPRCAAPVHRDQVTRG
jgi:hypothetical protein